MKKSLPKKKPVPDQQQINALAAFVEAAEELQREPLFVAENKAAAGAPGEATPMPFGDRFYFRSALTTFRRIWGKLEPAHFLEICKLVERFEGRRPEIDAVVAQEDEFTGRRWTNLPLTSREVVELWLGAVFAPASGKGGKRSTGPERLEFDLLAQAHGHAMLEFVCRSTVLAVGKCYFDLLKLARPALARWKKDHGLRAQFEIGAPFGPLAAPVVASGMTVAGKVSAEIPGAEPRQQKFERLLALEPFKGLKAIFDGLRRDRAAICDSVSNTGSYQELLTKLGYRVVLAPQIHVQDCYSRLGPEGGIRAVLPFHDVAGYRTLVTLVNFDSTVTTTPDTAGFFNTKLSELKLKLSY